MILLKAIIDFFIVILLIRLLIKPNEAFFNPIYSLIYRVTDPVLIPAKYVTRNHYSGIYLILAAFVLIRGFVYFGLGSMPMLKSLGISFLELFKLLFQAYMVMWFISALSKQTFGSSFLNLIQRAFTPIFKTAVFFRINRRYFSVFSFLFLWLLYSLLSTLIYWTLLTHGMTLFSPAFGFLEGLLLIVALFPFPGFFSLVIVVGALMSWVSPDPSNPIVQAIYGISEPILAPFRRYIPLLGGIDLSPIVALLCFQFIGSLIVQIITGIMSGGTLGF
jgi:YggT family protein